MITIKYMQNSYWLLDSEFPLDHSQHRTEGDARRGCHIYLCIKGKESDVAFEYCKDLKVTKPKKPKITWK